MVLTRPPAGAPADSHPEGEPAPGLCRLWQTPLVAHAAALAVLLVVLAAWVGPRTSWTADEGATIHEVHSLDGGSWLLAHPLPAADPQGADYPIALADWGTKGVAPLVRHPAYPALLSPLYRLAGIPGLVGASLAGAVLAALAAGQIAGMIEARLARPTLWLVGAGSPVFFYGFVVVAHTLAVAAGLGATLALLAAGRARRRSSRLALVVAGGALVFAGVALRTEALFLAPGLAAGLAVSGGRLGYSRIGRALTAGGVLAAALAALVLDKVWFRSIVGAAVVDPGRSGFPSPAGNGLLADRISGLKASLLTASIDGLRPAVLLLVGAAACLAGAVWLLRRAEADPRLAAALVAVAGAAVVLRLLVAPLDAVTGLLVAFPAWWVGLASLERSSVASPVNRFLLVTGAVAASGVAATIYPEGGGLEWGGRYFLLAAAVVTPVAVAGLADAAGRFPGRSQRRLAAAGLGAATLALSVLGVAQIADFHRAGQRQTAAINVAAAALGDPRPVVVATGPALPRGQYEQFDQQRWLFATADRPYDATLLDRLRAAGVTQFLLVTTDVDHQAPLLAGARNTTEVATVGHLHILRVQLAPP